MFIPVFVTLETWQGLASDAEKCEPVRVREIGFNPMVNDIWKSDNIHRLVPE